MRTLLVAGSLLIASLGMADAFDNQVASIQLLQSKPVQKEVALTEAQRSKMNKFAEEFNKQAGVYQAELAKKSDNGKKQVKRDQNREMKMLVDLKSKVLATLGANQIKRLRELSLQAIGVTALGDDAVAAKVGINATQKDQIRKLVKTGLDNANKLLSKANENASKGIAQPKNQAEAQKAQKQFETKREAEQKKIQPQLSTIRSSTIKGVMAILNAKQRATWNALLGKAFTG